jgi:molybdenum cofactor guanylyltransferase
MDALIGAVLAGGRSSRIGAPKATLELGGRPLISYPLAAMVAAGLETIVVAKPDSELPEMGNEVWPEPQEPSHPLLGIVTALQRAAGRPVLVCGCDMPFVTAELISHLAHRDGPIVLPFAGGRYHPMLARYQPSLAPALASALEQQRPLQQVVAASGPELIDERGLAPFGDPERLLFNVNTPADLERARELLNG